MKADNFWLYKGRALMGGIGLVFAALGLLQFWMAHGRVHADKNGWALVHGLCGLMFVRIASDAIAYADKKHDELFARKENP